MVDNRLLEIERRLLGDIYTSPAAMDNLTVLCDNFGSRFAGTPGERAAVEFFLERMQEYGLSGVHAEDYAYTGWKRGAATLAVVRPVERPIPCISLPYCPPATVEAELISVHDGAPADFERAGEALRGRILMATSRPPRGLPRTVHRSEKYQRSVLAGAAAFLYANQYEGYGPETGSIANDREAPIPGISISREDAAYLQRLAERGGPVVLRLQTTDRSAPARSWNVVGELPGDTEDSDWVLLGSHYDGHDISQGAEDPASGAVAVLEAARALAADTTAAERRRPIRFVFFGTEEIGLIGAYRYVEAHDRELDTLRFFLNMDAAGGAGRKGVSINRWPELDPFFENARREMAAEMPFAQKVPGFSDHFPFFLKGAVIGMMGDPEAVDTGRGFGHTAFDTLDKVRLGNLRNAAANACRLALRIARADEWPAGRRSQEAVQAIIASEPSLAFMCVRDQLAAAESGDRAN